jgi:multiple sugar transport system permease protein
VNSTLPRGAHRQRLEPGRLFAFGLLCMWSCVCLFPLVWIVVTSLKNGRQIDQGPFYLPFVDFLPNLDAWTFILTEPNDNLIRRYANSVVVGVVSTMLTLLFGGGAVYGLTRFRFGLPAVSTSILWAILATRILPPVVLVLPLYLLALMTGTLDTLLALIVVNTGANLPVAVWLLLPVFSRVASEPEEAAQLDGASHLQIFFTILLPMIAGRVAIVGLLIFLLCWNEYLYAAYLAGYRATTVPPWMVQQLSMREAQVGGDTEEWAHLSAAMVAMILPVLAAAAFVQRQLARSIASR